MSATVAPPQQTPPQQTEANDQSGAPRRGSSPYGDGRFARFITRSLFASRWLQVPLYVGLIVAQLLYVYTFVAELWHLANHVTTLNEADMMLAVLGLVDVVMVANLLVMTIIGGYETFVSRMRLDHHPDQPEWLSEVNANVLKVKLAMAIIGISSVHLLKSFVEAKEYYMDPVLSANANNLLMWQTGIHLAFILSAMALAWIAKIDDHHSR